MKIISKFIAVLGILILVPGFTAQGQSSPAPKHKEITVWLDASLGSHIGGGYASTYLTNIRARTIAKEDPELRKAINTLDGLGMVEVRGFGLVPAAVAWQTATPTHTLVQEQADTNLSYGELLMVHSLAAKSGESFAQVVALRAKSPTWGEVAKHLQVDPAVIVTRANLASTRIRLADYWVRRRPLREGGTNYTSINPHTQQSRLH
jgi:hypothetical protein